MQVFREPPRKSGLAPSLIPKPVFSSRIKTFDPIALTLFRVARFCWKAPSAANLYKDSTYRRIPEVGLPACIDLQEFHEVWNFVERQPQSFQDDASKYPSCTHGAGSAISSPYSPRAHGLLPRPQVNPLPGG